MKNQKDSSIIDTNIWIHFLLQKNSFRCDSIIYYYEVILLYGKELIDKFVAVVKRPKFKRYFKNEDIESVLLKIQNRAVLIQVTSVVTACCDIKNNFLLALALDSKATHLVTGDKDLLIMEKFGTTTILTIADYIDTLK